MGICWHSLPKLTLSHLKLATLGLAIACFWDLSPKVGGRGAKNSHLTRRPSKGTIAQ